MSETETTPEPETGAEHERVERTERETEREVERDVAIEGPEGATVDVDTEKETETEAERLERESHSEE